ncbi:MAG: class I SAM-dependent methyltransferase [Saprospiraceae bacterium]|nr:class I SAM-dependent methyltransferase [Saprospiraceae bacterium]
MPSTITNEMHLANKKRWDASAKRWAECADSRGIWKKCHEDPSIVFSPTVLKYLSDIKGKKVAVLGSGDNEAVFALAGLGAAVTSVDISAKQLQYAAERAQELDLSIQFIQSDVTNLSAIEDAQFDLIYTGGHVAVWVSELQKYYQEAARILKPGGWFLVDEYHPFRRVWKKTSDVLEIQNEYYHRGPYEYAMGDDVLYQQHGVYTCYEFHWTIGDFINAVIQAGCLIREIDEHGTYVGDWEVSPMQGLPEFFLIVAQKQIAS